MKPSNSNIKANRARGEIWKDWAVASQEGNKVAYNRLLSEIAPFIKNFLITRVANPDWADDITQDVLISVHKSLKTYSGDRPFTPWLMAIINFRKTDFLRKHYSSRSDKQTTMDDAEFLSSHVTESPYAGEYKDIEAALATLPEQQRKVFEMMRIKGFTAQEVANEMNMSVSAVKVSAHRTAGKLKGILEG
ncbi:MAG: RNA polymerase sigma factor [Bdellovibrionales bacterium]